MGTRSLPPCTPWSAETLGWERAWRPIDLPLSPQHWRFRLPLPHPSPSLEAPSLGAPRPPVLGPTLAEHSLFSLALGAQRARLSPLDRWQHLLLHWALFRQSSPSSCAGWGGGVGGWGEPSADPPRPGSTRDLRLSLPTTPSPVGKGGGCSEAAWAGLHHQLPGCPWSRARVAPNGLQVSGSHRTLRKEPVKMKAFLPGKLLPSRQTFAHNLSRTLPPSPSVAPLGISRGLEGGGVPSGRGVVAVAVQVDRKGPSRVARVMTECP